MAKISASKPDDEGSTPSKHAINEAVGKNRRYEPHVTAESKSAPTTTEGRNVPKSNIG